MWSAGTWVECIRNRYIEIEASIAFRCKRGRFSQGLENIRPRHAPKPRNAKNRKVARNAALNQKQQNIESTRGPRSFDCYVREVVFCSSVPVQYCCSVQFLTAARPLLPIDALLLTSRHQSEG